MLFVFLMAAVIAITLYMELPRVAMQAQRDKEQRLIDTGEQYKRAIQLFVAKAKRYPGDIKELESFQNQRFLRRRYKDPMTGKDEWRLIHVGPGGILTDSKISKPAGPGADKPAGPNGFVGEQTGLAAQNPIQGAGAPNQRDRRRASDSANGTMPGPALPGQPGGDLANGQNNGVPPLPGQNPDNGQNPNQLPGTQTINGPPVQGLPGQQTFPVPPGTPMQGQQGMPGTPMKAKASRACPRCKASQACSLDCPEWRTTGWGPRKTLPLHPLATPSSAEAVPSWVEALRMSAVDR